MISIVVPTFNSERFLPETLQSIFQQNYTDIEVIVADGGSRDKTISIIQNYIVKYPGKIIHKYFQPKGEPDAINQGMKLAKGNIVAFLDSDDIYLPDTFQNVHNHFARNPYSMWCYGKSKIIDSNGKIIRPEITRIKEYFQPKYAYWKLLCLDFITQPTVFMRRSAREEIGEFNTELKFSFEYDFWCRLGEKFKPGFINEYQAYWRANPLAVSEQSGAHVEEAWQAYKIASFYSKGYFWLRPIQWMVRNLQIVAYQTITQNETL